MSTMIRKILNRKTLKITALALSLMGVSVQKSRAVSVTIGGNIQITNLLNASPEMGLDLTSTAASIRVAAFTITNNTTSFNLNLSFLNGGGFINAGNAQEVDMTLITLGPEGSGTLGTGIAALVPGAAAEGATFVAGGDLTAVVAGAGPDLVVWNPANQSTATSGFVLELLGSWAASTNLAGLYTEVITATLVATL